MKLDKLEKYLKNEDVYKKDELLKVKLSLIDE